MKVLLVDDESYIVEYLKHLVRWQKLGFYEVLGYSDPLEAKERLSKGDIDLLITDISMPEINGIDLLKFIHDKSFSTITIFLSSYSEFEYAQQAIRYGLTEYLLKPITKESLEKSLNNVLELLSLGGNEAKEKPISLQQLFFSQLALFPLEYVPFSTEEYCFFQFVGHSIENNEMYFKIKDNEVSGVSNFSSISSTYNRISNKIVGNQASLWQKEFYDFFYQLDFHLGSFDELEKIIKSYFLKLTNHEKLSQSYHEFYPQLREEEKLIFLVNTIAFLYFNGKSIDNQETNIFNLRDTMEQKRVLDSLQKYYEEHYQVFSIKEIIKKTNRYILDNLEKDLSLELLANRAFLNPAYFSTLYKQETGVNISSYIQEARLEQATKMLTETNLKVIDVGKLVGYPHPQYFTKIFRERYGITPNRYRKRNN